MRLIAIDGPPGSGKTTTIIKKSTGWGDDTAIVTYTNDAAAVLHKRAEWLPAGTVYSLTWPYVKPFVKGGIKGTGANLSYGTRKIHHLFDPALIQYETDAPSNRRVTRQDLLAVKLHAWASGDPPFDLNAEQAVGALKFILPVAKWVQAGCPMEDKERLNTVVIDEAQDMSWVELRAALGLLKEDGIAYAYGDPGQSIFGTSKGIIGRALPPVWICADEKRMLTKGYRVGDPVATIASRVLKSYYERPPTTFRAEHTTQILSWNNWDRPIRGLALGYSRRAVAKAFRNWGLKQTGVVPNVACADKELCLSTGHSAKGAEADDVYILPWSRQAIKRLEQKDPETVRLLYVMLTRARRRVFLPVTLKARLAL